jgi:hypothetical protein
MRGEFMEGAPWRTLLRFVTTCLAMLVVAQSAVAATAHLKATGGGRPSKTTAKVACKRLPDNKMRCTMTIKGGAGISGSVAMRIKRGKVVVAVGHGRLRHGKATLTMRVLRPITRGRYTVTMVITRATIRAKKVLQLP